MATETIYNTNTTQPWETQQPFLDYGFNQSRSLYDQGGPQYYGGQNYVDFSQGQNQALDRINQRSMGGSGVNQAATNQMTSTLNGDFLNGNPYLDKTYDQAAGKVRGSIDSQFAGAGRYGSGIHQDVMGDNLGDLANNIYGGNYQAERGRQMQMMPLANSIANQDYYDMAMQNQAGGQVQQQGQTELNANMDRWNFDQNRAQNNLQNYNQNVSGNYGQSSSGSQTNPIYEPSFGQQALGYGMAGVGLLGAANDIFDWWK